MFIHINEYENGLHILTACKEALEIALLLKQNGILLHFNDCDLWINSSQTPEEAVDEYYALANKQIKKEIY